MEFFRQRRAGVVDFFGRVFQNFDLDQLSGFQSVVDLFDKVFAETVFTDLIQGVHRHGFTSQKAFLFSR